VHGAFNIADDGGIWSGRNYPPVESRRRGQHRLTRISLMLADRGANAPTIVKSPVSCRNLCLSSAPPDSQEAFSHSEHVFHRQLNDA
jgi:hypothetical protein